MPHPNETMLKSVYEGFTNGDMAPLASLLTVETKWCITGTSPVSGTYNGTEEIFGFFGKIMDLYSGTFQIEVRDIMANDQHGAVVATEHGMVCGELLEFTSVHMYSFSEGLCTQFMSYEDDVYHQFWSRNSVDEAATAIEPSAVTL